MSARGQVVRVLDHDPELGAELGAEELQTARLATVATIERRGAGPWTPDAFGESLCGLVLNGLIVKELAVAGTVSAELLGPGDVLLPPAAPEVSFVPTDVGWVVLEPVTVAWLGATFEQAVRRWPGLNRALLQRITLQAARAAFLQNLAQVTRIEDRVLILLWHLAERFGRVGPNGVVLPLRMTHRMVARLVGARRPSVTTAVVALERAGSLARRPDGALVLRSEPEQLLLGSEAPAGPWAARGSGNVVLDELRTHWAGNAERRAEQAAQRAESSRDRAAVAREHGRSDALHTASAEMHERARDVHRNSSERLRAGQEQREENPSQR